MTRDQMKFELDGQGPLYRQIKRAVSGPILSGRCRSGTRLPSEYEFTEIFATSRMTVNRALQMLADEGLVVRRRRKGTSVAPRIAEHAVMELRDIGDEIEEMGAAYSYALLQRRDVVMDAIQAGHFDATPGSPALFLNCLHSSDGEPVLIEERFINLSTVPDALGEPFDVTPPNRWLLRNVPWSRVEHVILAVNAAGDCAALLRIPPGEACLCLERTTWKDDRSLTHVRLTYPGSRHRLLGRFSTRQ